MYSYNPGLWGPCYGYLSILICLCPCRVAARRWYAGYLCVLFSSLWVGPLSQTWLRDPVGASRATSPLNDVTRFFKKCGSSQLVSERNDVCVHLARSILHEEHRLRQLQRSRPP